MRLRPVLPIALVAVLLLAAGSALAQSPLGIGTAEPSILPAGPGWRFLAWVNQQQQEFYRALTGSLTAMRTDPRNLWGLVGLSFAYGIFHAAGPGHGKAVISSYMIANEVVLRRGVILSFLSAIMQALMAILAIGAAYLVLRGTTFSLTDATHYMELASYLLIAAFGAWLLWRKMNGHLIGKKAGGHNHRLHHHHPDHDSHGHGVGHDHHHSHEQGHDHGHTEHTVSHKHPHGEVCATCGHLHAPDPAMISGRDFSLREAWGAILAVGMRPCSGALLVLTFSLLNGLYLGGIMSVFAMALGTAITVSILATLAVSAKGVAVRLSGDGRAERMGFAIEILGAFTVMALGIILFAAAL